MRRAALAVLAATLAAGACGAAQRSWNDQNRAMGYYIIHFSSINAINGLNLTRAQAEKLRGLARDLETQSGRPPDFTGDFRPDLAQVRDTYNELRATLMNGEEVSPELEKKVGAARTVEAAVIRLSIVSQHTKGGDCLSCHIEPRVPDVRAQTDAAVKALTPPRPQDRDLFMAHMLGIFTQKGMAKVNALAPEVDRILTDSQKDVLQNFTCCLVPPKNLRDPVRAGQATGGDREMEILRRVRGVPEAMWPVAKTQVQARLDMLLVAKRPGITEALKAEVREQALRVCEKARAMSDTDFELEKETLAKELSATLGAPAKLDANQKRFMAALFLLVPGSSEVYASLMRRLDAKPRAQ